MKKTSRSPAVIVAHATQPPPKPKEIIQALLARERVRLEEHVAAAKTTLITTQKAAAKAEDAWRDALIPSDIDAAMAHTYGKRIKVELEEAYGNKSEMVEPRLAGLNRRYGNRMVHARYVRCRYKDGDGDDSAIFTSAASFPTATKEGREWLDAFVAMAKAEHAISECSYVTERGTMDPHEKWILQKLSAFRAKAESHTPAKAVADRVAALLTNKETVAALDTIRDRINSGVAAPKSLELVPA